MKVYINENAWQEQGSCLALGSFDALHRAHMKLIETAVCYAKQNGMKSGVYQFTERPEFLLNPSAENKIVYTNEQKIEIIEKSGADFVYFEKFDEEFMKLSCENFVKMLVEKFNLRCAVAGFHYSFGYKGMGDCRLLCELGKKYGFEVIIIDAVKYEGILVSSTYIRSLISEGDVKGAGEFLGRCYSIKGNVIKDRGVGTAVLQIPTANLQVDERLVLPKFGVYATYVKYNNKNYPAVTNIGIRPTFGLDSVSIESHILNFNGELYGEDIELFFLDRIRDEKKFENSEQLKAQILSDIAKAELCFCDNLK